MLKGGNSFTRSKKIGGERMFKRKRKGWKRCFGKRGVKSKREERR